MDRRGFLKRASLCLTLPMAANAILPSDAAKAERVNRIIGGSFMADGGPVHINLGFVPDYIQLTMIDKKTPVAQHHWFGKDIARNVNRKDVLFVAGNLAQNGQEVRFLAMKSMEKQNGN